MLKRLLAHIAPLPIPPPQPEDDKQQVKDAREPHAFVGAVAMPWISPPNAANDDPMESVQKVVEYALAQSGYLR